MFERVKAYRYLLCIVITLSSVVRADNDATLSQMENELLGAMKTVCKESNDSGFCPLVALTVRNHIGRFCNDFNYKSENECKNAPYSDFVNWLLKESKTSPFPAKLPKS